MERRNGSRAQVDLPIRAIIDGHRHHCRAIDLSPHGMVFERTRALRNRTLLDLNAFEIYLDGRPIRTRARNVWSKDGLQAVRFVTMHDVDRLTIAEMLDTMSRARAVLH